MQICGGTSVGIAQTKAFHGHDGHDGEAAEPVPLRLSRVEQMLGEPTTTARVDEILTGFGLGAGSVALRTKTSPRKTKRNGIVPRTGSTCVAKSI